MGSRSASLFVASQLLAVATVCASEGPTVATWSGAFAAPAIAGPGVSAAGARLASGHLRLDVGGTMYPVAVNGSLVGVFFRGGRLAYTSNDPLEAASFRTNAERVGSLAVSGEGVITDTVDAALVLLSSGAGALAPDGWPAGEPPAEAVEALAAHVRRFAGDKGARYGKLFPQAMVEPPGEPLVMAEIVAGARDLAYSYDTLRDQAESLAVLRDLRSDESFLKGTRVPDLISLQPIGRGRLDPAPRRFLQTDLDVTVVNPTGLRAEVTARTTFRALAPVQVLDLALWSSHVGTVGLGAKPAQHEYVLAAVRDAAGRELPFAHLDDDLLVELPGPLAPGQSVDLSFTVSGDVLFNPGNDAYWSLPTAPWFPTPNRLDCQSMSYHAVVKVPKPFTPFSCGTTVRRWDEGDMACAEFREDKPIQIPVVLAGRYTTESETRNGVTVSVSSYGKPNPRAAKSLITNVHSLMEFYKPFLGGFPFAEMKIIEINAYGFGQAPAGVIFITKEAFSPLQDEASRLFSQGINARLAHELAHTWWGHVAKLGGWEDQWLSESLAEYFSAFAMGRVRRASEFDAAVKEWKAQSRFLKDRGTVFTANLLSGEKAFEDRYLLLYAKGPLVLHALRQELGDSAFLTICKSYLKSFDFKVAETRHFIGLTNFVTKKDYTEWFGRYLLGAEWPKV